ncbi:Peptide methionine sulfoxide reductase [Parasponia andersonii]|uniref:peptide-methionine (S)-S-oxide reductase n=1 Tax=Parasponia andersonii TaxID=3476 RepID=A0A2P5CG69_PARAD|nr:Peptide methionine sulfoxide reductase [Parasponia andersonii]
MLKSLASTTTTTTTAPFLLISSSTIGAAAHSLSRTFLPSLSNLRPKPISPFPQTHRPFSLRTSSMNLLNKLGFGHRSADLSAESSSIAQGPDEDVPAPGQQFAQFGAGCFWGVELAFQRVPGVTKTEVGYSQGLLHNPTYEDICTGTTNHSEIVRVQYDPKECSYDTLLDVFWSRHDPTTLNRQNSATLVMILSAGNDVGTQYRSGIYYYTPEQEKSARGSLEKQQKLLNRKIVTELLPAKKFYRAEEYHQQYLAKGGRFGFKQSTDKGCNDPIRCYG